MCGRAMIDWQQSKIQALPEGGVKVFYNPRNPKKSYLIVAGKVGILATLVIATLPMLLYYVKFYL